MSKTVPLVLLIVFVASIGVFFYDTPEFSFLKSDSSVVTVTPHSVRNHTRPYDNGTLRAQWEQHKANYSKNFSNDTDDERRFNCYLDNLDKIQKHNDSNYTIGINEFTSECPEDFKRTHHNHNHTKSKNQTQRKKTPPQIPSDAKISVSKTSSGVSTSISISESAMEYMSGNTVVMIVYTTNTTNTTTANGATTVTLTINVTTVTATSHTTVITVYCSGASCPSSGNSTTNSSSNNSSSNSSSKNSSSNSSTSNTSSNSSSNNGGSSTPSSSSSYFGGLPAPVPPSLLQTLNSSTPAASVDWRAVGKVSPIKNQAQCGSCWAFSTIGSMESLNLIKNGTNATSNYSEQQLVDCSLTNDGCNGGDPPTAMDWQMMNGTALETSYPYYSQNGNSNGAGACSSIKNGATQIYGTGRVNEGDVVGLQNAVAMQPVVVVVDASNWSPYTGGIYTSCTTNLDHAVLLVGYNSQYWIIKNSWGASWGTAGFIYVARSSACDTMLTSYPAFPLGSPRTANVDPYCSAYGAAACTDPNEITYMMGKIIFAINF